MRQSKIFWGEEFEFIGNECEITICSQMQGSILCIVRFVNFCPLFNQKFGDFVSIWGKSFIWHWIKSFHSLFFNWTIFMILTLNFEHLFISTIKHRLKAIEAFELPFKAAICNGVFESIESGSLISAPCSMSFRTLSKSPKINLL